MLSDATKIAILKSAPKLTHIELIELVIEECRLVPRTWVGLTDDDRAALIDDARFTRSDIMMVGDCIDRLIELIETRLREKNT